VPDPETHGLLNTVPGTIGMLQATEVLKLLLGVGEPLIGKLMLYDSLSVSLLQIHLFKRRDCPVCGKYFTPG
jgi:adenylyltransferase/sulfurtransferase